MLRITEERARESSEVRLDLVKFSVATYSTVHENIKCKKNHEISPVVLNIFSEMWKEICGHVFSELTVSGERRIRL